MFGGMVLSSISIIENRSSFLFRWLKQHYKTEYDKMISRMLSHSPEERPTAQDVYDFCAARYGEVEAYKRNEWT